ncbi:MAG: hypothetical protein IPF82_10245 [Blastocatellia bacterium]|nr:hypothetical protein [Blastocatellia bacterium]
MNVGNAATLKSGSFRVHHIGARILATVFVLTVCAGATLPAVAQTHAGKGHDLGVVDFRVSGNAKAQVEFNRAVALLHHMTYPQARQAFEKVVKIDPACPMAHWGIAMTLFQPLWPTRPGLDERRRGWDEVTKARALNPRTDRERLFVDAVAAFFAEPESPDYWSRIRRWEQSMKKVHDAFPNDPDATAFYALARLAVSPQDRISRTNADEAAALLLGVYERNHDHPGAMHYLVHASDVPGREKESLEIVDKYDAVAPRNPHALHMPTHIYTRLGNWDAVVRGNLRAAEASLEHPAGDRGQFVWDEFPHAIEYLVYAHLQQGADSEAAAQLHRLHGTPQLEPTFKTAFHLASTKARFALERRAWTEAVALSPREPSTLDWNRFFWPEGVTWFARGLGAAHTGELATALEASARLESLESSARNAGEELFARNIQILRLELNAWIAHAEKRTEASLSLMTQAVELEEATPKHSVTPGPTLPAAELLGDLLLDLSKPADALVAYQRSLLHYPGRFNSLLGAARSARASGNEALAVNYYAQLLSVGRGKSRAALLDEARSFVSTRR